VFLIARRFPLAGVILGVVLIVAGVVTSRRALDVTGALALLLGGYRTLATRRGRGAGDGSRGAR